MRHFTTKQMACTRLCMHFSHFSAPCGTAKDVSGVRDVVFADRSGSLHPKRTNDGHQPFRFIPDEAPGVPPSHGSVCSPAPVYYLLGSKVQEEGCSRTVDTAHIHICPQTSQLFHARLEKRQLTQSRDLAVCPPDPRGVDPPSLPDAGMVPR